MALFCLPFEKTQALLKAIKEGAFSPDDYASQPHTEARRAYLEQFVGKENAERVNALMESKMLLKNWQSGMVTAVKQLTGLSTAGKREFTARISNMEKMLSPVEEKQFYADITAKKLGMPVTMDVAKKINELAQKATEAKNTPTDNPSGVSNEYLKAASDLRGYIASQQPVSALSLIFRNLTTTMRNFLLMNPATPIKTIVGQIENTGLDAITRRMATLTRGKVDGGVLSQARSEVWKTYRATGLDVTKMTTLDDTGKLGEGHRFDTPAGMLSKNLPVRAAEIVTRQAAAITNKIAINWEHNIAFTKFHQMTFVDMANIAATKFANGDVAKATEIFNDAMKINPITDVGRTVRDMAQFNGGRVTGTQNTLLGEISSEIVNRINKRVPGLGNFLFQIVKIPTNLISYGLENSGGGFLTGPLKMLEGRKLMESSDLATQYQGAAKFARGTQTLIRTAGVVTAGLMITNSLGKRDFLTDRYGQGYVRIGGTWINMEYFYAIAPIIAGLMEIKKSGAEGFEKQAQQFAQGVAGSVRRIPILDEVNAITSDLTANKYSSGLGKYISSDLGGRLQPAFLRQLERGNGIKGLFFSSAGLPDQKELKKLGAR